MRCCILLWKGFIFALLKTLVIRTNKGKTISIVNFINLHQVISAAMMEIVDELLSAVPTLD
eukprot:85781-Amphidinium_carterae.1